MVYNEKRLSIVADENIPMVCEVFSSLGDVKLLSAREISAEIARDADVLLVRSVTRVDSELLTGSRVKFVGTATIGIDHIDIDFLQKNNIFFSNAAGSNANSVAEYFITSLLNVARYKKILLSKKTLGIIGVGNIGSIVAKKAVGLGLKVMLNDPPRQRTEGGSDFAPLVNVLKADIVTCHTPLIKSGPDRTVHLLGAEELAVLSPNCVLVNTGRGPVVDNRALKNWLMEHPLASAILDVWETEPEPDLELLELVDIATPHIAGYSFDGKVNGTTMIYESLCGFLGIEPEVDVAGLMPGVENGIIELDLADFADIQAVLTAATAIAYDLEGDDKRMRGIIPLVKGEQGRYFDKLRKEYPIRREFANYTVKLKGHNSSLNCNELVRSLQIIGFNVS